MKTRASHRARGLVLLVALFAYAAASQPAFSFDSGYHFDLSRDALAREGFGEEAIAAVQLCGFYGDALEMVRAAQPRRGPWAWPDEKAQAWARIFAVDKEQTAAQARLMHFQNLENYEDFAAAWEALARNTRQAAKGAAQAGDAQGLLAVLGISLHAVQDFYAHSNWAAKDWGGDATWFDVPAEARLKAGIGRAHRVKDGPAQPHFEAAYRAAFYASWQWVGMVRAWAGEESAVWLQARAYVSPTVKDEGRIAFYLSAYAGRWKGPQSKSEADLALLAEACIKNANKAFGHIGKWRQLHPSMTAAPDMTAPPAAEAPYVPAQKWLRVTFVQVQEARPDPVWRIDTLGEPDFYARVKINGREYREATYENRRSLKPENWLTLAPVWPDDRYARIQIEIWDQDAGGARSLEAVDDQCDIAPTYRHMSWLTYAPLAALSQERTFQTNGAVKKVSWMDPAGDGDEAACKFSLALEQPARRGAPAGARPPEAAASRVPEPPLVSDEGELSSDAQHLRVVWEDVYRAGAALATSYEIRVRDHDRGTVVDWHKAATSNIAKWNLNLEDGHTYFVDVRAINAAGASRPGTSDGITVDTQGPRVKVESFTQTTSWPLGEKTEDLSIVYPNSFEVSLRATERGAAGFDSYLIWIAGELSLRTGGSRRTRRADWQIPDIRAPVLKADIKADDLRGGMVVLRGLPYLYHGRTYTMRVRGRDRLGNLGEEVTAKCRVRFSDYSPPPTVKVNIAEARPLRLTWNEISDPESGIAEYQVAIATRRNRTLHPDILGWRSVGLATQYRHKGRLALPRQWFVFVKAINGMGQESIASLQHKETDLFLPDIHRLPGLPELPELPEWPDDFDSGGGIIIR